ncbi:MAG: primase C-terminal domain-containing protein [Nanoarchaeota archaeon]|nr:primase C-terminal domain-containing protein [Nanoarchaeota archaeon]
MNLRVVRSWYQREDVQEALLALAKDREVVGVYATGSFSKRPGTLIHLKDILALVNTGVVEFHCSLEHWRDPSSITAGDYAEQRTGFDIVLDIDVDQFEVGRTAAVVLMRKLRSLGLKGVSAKFSGNTGFHIGIPWKSMPHEINFKPTKDQFPGVGRAMGAYLKEQIRDDLAVALKKLIPDVTDPFTHVEIDPVLISPRHLFRMPYSLHKTTGLVSVPVPLDELAVFTPDQAAPDKITKIRRFLDQGRPGEAETLVAEALDTAPKAPSHQRPRQTTKRVVPKEDFPPCVQTILDGLDDGRNRSMFVLVNFLAQCNWKADQIEALILEWNAKNTPPLPESSVRNYLRTKLRQLELHGPKPPPNCTQEGYYVSMGVCFPDKLCVSRESLKNPLNYPLKKYGREQPKKKDPKKGLIIKWSD